MAEKIEIILKKFVQETETHRYVGTFVDPTKVVDTSKFEQTIEDLTQRITNSQTWKASVPSLASIATTYPSPKEGWTVSVDDTNTIYRYDAATSKWVDILKNNNSLASATSAGLMSPELYKKLSESKPYVHPDKHPADIIEETQEKRFVTQTMVQNWNALVSFPGFETVTPYTGSANKAARSDHKHETLTGIKSLSNGSYSINLDSNNLEFVVNPSTKLELTTTFPLWKGKQILVEGSYNPPLSDVTGIAAGWKRLLADEPSAMVTQHPEWNEIRNKPVDFTPSAHTHQVSEISNINSAWQQLLVKAPEQYVTQHPAWDEIRNKPEFFPTKKQSMTTLEAWPRDEQFRDFEGLRIRRYKASELAPYNKIVTKFIFKQPQDPSETSEIAGATFELNFGVSRSSGDPSMQIKFTNPHLSYQQKKDFTIPFVESSNGYVWEGYHDFRSGAGNSGSDMRFKRDIVKVSDMYDFVRNLDIFRYNWIKPNEERSTFGVNSDQLQNSGLVEIESMVHERSDEDKTKWVEYDRFGLVALKVIQEMQEKLEAQEKRIRVLEKALESKIKQ